jgi:hypothetical protein
LLSSLPLSFSSPLFFLVISPEGSSFLCHTLLLLWSTVPPQVQSNRAKLPLTGTSKTEPNNSFLLLIYFKYFVTVMKRRRPYYFISILYLVK